MKKGLGKGLDAFWSEEQAVADAPVSEIKVLDIDRCEYQPRKDFDEAELTELAQSIATVGVIQPVIVVKNGNRYMLVAGERRWRAAIKAGLKTIPAVVRDYAERQVREIALIENVQRADLNEIEKAEAMQTLAQRYSLTQEELAQRLSMSRPAVANSMRLLNLTAKVREMVRSGALSAGQARALISIKDENKQLVLAQRIVKEGLSARQAEALASNEKENKKPARKIIPPNAELVDFEEKLCRKMHTKVKIDGDLKRGKIVISYFSADELEALYESLIGEEE
jgi:ParB family chromosome partitioning protein